MKDNTLIYLMESTLNTDHGVPETTFNVFCELRDMMEIDTPEHSHVCDLLEACDAVDGFFYLPEDSGINLVFPNGKYSYYGNGDIEPRKGNKR
jgi:hypothetical protein